MVQTRTRKQNNSFLDKNDSIRGRSGRYTKIRIWKQKQNIVRYEVSKKHLFLFLFLSHTIVLACVASWPRSNHYRLFAENSVWVGFLVVCYLHKINPNRQNKYLLWEKVAPKCHFSPNFSWVGLALGWGVRRFHDNIHVFSNPTEFSISQIPYWLMQGGRGGEAGDGRRGSFHFFHTSDR